MTDELFIETYKNGTKARVELSKRRGITAFYSQQNRKTGSKKNHQAILKITGFVSSVDRTLDHLSYISKNNKIEIETSFGDILTDKGEVEDIVDEWSIDFNRKKIANNFDKKYVVTFKSINDDEQNKVFDRVNVFADSLENMTVRVDKSRSEKDPYSVILRVTESDDSLAFSDIIHESIIDEFDDLKIKVDEKKRPMPRDAMKIILSSPEGTDPEKTKLAARNYLHKVHGDNGFDYMFSLHTNTKNPHVHAIIQMTNPDGVRIKALKNDLKIWREEWAISSRDQGIQVEASYRTERGVSAKSEKTGIVMMRKHRNIEPSVYKDPENYIDKVDKIYRNISDLLPWEKGVIRKNIQEKRNYFEDSKVLKEHADRNKLSDKYDDMDVLSRVLENESIELPIPIKKVDQLISRELGLDKNELDTDELEY